MTVSFYRCLAEKVLFCLPIWSFPFSESNQSFFSHSVSVIFSYYSDFYLFKYILIESVEMHVRMHRSESNSGREKKIAARWWWYCAHGKKSTRLATIVLFIHNKLFTKEETFFSFATVEITIKQNKRLLLASFKQK